MFNTVQNIGGTIQVKVWMTGSATGEKRPAPYYKAEPYIYLQNITCRLRYDENHICNNAVRCWCGVWRGQKIRQKIDASVLQARARARARV